MNKTATNAEQKLIDACVRDYAEKIAKTKGDYDTKKMIPLLTKLVYQIYGYKEEVIDSFKREPI